MTQTNSYPTLGLNEEMAAYKALKEHYGLKAKQRDLLDASPMLGTILRHAHLGELDVAGGLLVEAGVMDLAQMVAAA